MLFEVRDALRSLRRRPGSALVAVVTLALGVGANTALFSIADAVLLRPLPFPESERLVLVAGSPEPGFPHTPLSFPEFDDIREQSRAFETVAAWTSFTDTRFNVTGGARPEDVQYALVSANFFSTLGVGAQAGRLFGPSDERPGLARPVVVSHGFWQRRFGASGAFPPRPLTLDGRPYDIVGVLPADFRFITYPRQPDIFLPLALDPVPGRQYARGARFLGVVARLANGHDVHAARAEQAVLLESMARENPGFYRARTFQVVPLQVHVTAGIRPAVVALWGAVGLVLLIACVNVANLFLVRAAGRGQELAIRVALGAGRLRIVRQLVTESLLIAAVASAIALLLASWATDIVAFLALAAPSPFVPYDFTRDQFAIDARVVTVTLLTAGVAGVGTALLPAMRAARTDLGETLRRASAHVVLDGGRAGRLLVVVEIALSLILLVGAGLVLKSLVRLQRVDPGFEPRQVLTFDVSLPRSTYADPARTAAFSERLVERVGALPGVTAVGTTDALPFSGADQSTGFFIEGRPPTAADETPDTHQRSVSPGYFEAMGIALVEGRRFTDDDIAGAPGVAIVNETMARLHWPEGSAVGKRLTLDLEAWRFHPDRPPDLDIAGGRREIVGVVDDVLHGSPGAAPLPEMYIPQAQRPSRQMTVAVRSGTDPALMADAVRAAVQALDPDQAVSNIRTMSDLVNVALAPYRLHAKLASVFAVLAVILAMVGLYAVMAHAVTQRAREIGVRMALGASRPQILALVLGQGGRLIATGLALGVAGAVASTHVAGRLLFQISPTDPETFALTGMLLGALALLACYVPARRAAGVNPVATLRGE